MAHQAHCRVCGERSDTYYSETACEAWMESHLGFRHRDDPSVGRGDVDVDEVL